MSFLRELENVIRDDPWGMYCACCKGVNTYADDCGWFVQPVSIHGMRFDVALCRDCMRNKMKLPLGDR